MHTKLYFSKMEPNKTLSNAGEIATGRKQFKDRITVAILL
jgi:hypothetical protein